MGVVVKVDGDFEGASARLLLVEHRLEVVGAKAVRAGEYGDRLASPPAKHLSGFAVLDLDL